MEGKRSSPRPLDCASVFLGSTEPPLHVTRELWSAVGGAVRRPGQAEELDGKLPVHSYAPRASLLDTGLSQCLTPTVEGVVWIKHNLRHLYYIVLTLP